MIWFSILPCVLAAALPVPSGAKPMDLTDPRPRLIYASFEILDPDASEGGEEQFCEPFLGRLRPGDSEDQITVAIPGRAVEELMADQNPEPGSFSEFIWAFDVKSGHVVSARVSGILKKILNLGLFKTSVYARIKILMSTLVPGGEEKPRNLLGFRFSTFCDNPEDAGCMLFHPASYDANTGRVEAVGPLSAITPFVTTRSMAPFGKAIFSEDPEGLVSNVPLSPPATR